MKVSSNFNSIISNNHSRQFDGGNKKVGLKDNFNINSSGNTYNEISKINIDAAKGSQQFFNSIATGIKNISSSDILTVNSSGIQNGSITNINSVYNSKGLIGSDFRHMDSVALLFENKV